MWLGGNKTATRRRLLRWWPNISASTPAQLPIVRLDVPKHQFVNLDIAVEALIAEHGGGELVGVGGGDQRHHQTLGDLLQQRGRWGIPVGPVDRTRVETGPTTSRVAVTSGIHLFHVRRHPGGVVPAEGQPALRLGDRVEVMRLGRGRRIAAL